MQPNDLPMLTQIGTSAYTFRLIGLIAMLAFAVFSLYPAVRDFILTHRSKTV